jgi:HSP20 family protein
MTNQPSSKLQRTNGSTMVKIVPTEGLFERLKETYQSVAHRAYELFEGRGREQGHDLEDWFGAEAELFPPIPIKISESDDQITVRAEANVFSAKDLELSVGPNRLVISGNTERKAEEETRKGATAGRRSGEVFCALGLPAEVDPAKATAKLQDGVLEVILPKARSRE